MSHCLLNSSRYDTIVHMIMLVGKDGQIIELDGVSAMPERPAGPIIIESTTHADLRRLAEKFSLDYGNLSDALDINEAPRLEHRNNYDYLYLRLPSAKGNRNVAVATRPLLLVYNSRTLMLISGYKLQPVLDASLIHDLSRIPSSTEALVYVLARIINAFEYHIKIQTDAIHNVVVKMQKHRLQNEDFANFVMIEEQINNFISALTPLIPLFNRLQTDQYSRCLYDTFQWLVKSCHEDTNHRHPTDCRPQFSVQYVWHEHSSTNAARWHWLFDGNALGYTASYHLHHLGQEASPLLVHAKIETWLLIPLTKWRH